MAGLVKFAITSGSALAGFYGLVLVALYAGQGSMLFPAPDVSGVAVPAPFQRATIPTPDGERLKALYLPGPAGAPQVLFFHGNGAAAVLETPRALRLREAGFGVLLATYRGYGGSSGSPSEAGLIADGLAAYDWLRRQDAGPVHLYAHSLGTGVAVRVATERPVASLVLEASYSSIADVAANAWPWFPVRRLIRNPFRTVDHIGAVTAPVLMMHGMRDTVIAPRFGRALHAAAPDAEWHWLEGAGHNDMTLHGSIERAIAFMHAAR